MEFGLAGKAVVVTGGVLVADGAQDKS